MHIRVITTAVIGIRVGDLLARLTWRHLFSGPSDAA